VASCFTLVSCLAYSFTLKIEMKCSSETLVVYNGLCGSFTVVSGFDDLSTLNMEAPCSLRGGLSKKTELFKFLSVG
jgi:fluoride ion exporter CrcB/FEX